VRRRLLLGTSGIAVLCVLILGVPLILLARHQVWTSARDRVREQAANAAVDVEDQLELNRPLDLHRLLRLMPDRHITVADTERTVVAAGGARLHDPVVAHAVAADYVVTVQAPRWPVVARARTVTAVLAGLALAAVAAAVALALWQSRRLAAPVGRLLARADDLGRGDFTVPPLASGIPEIDAVAQALDRSARQIGTLVELQRDFAADAAHQLRTPLTSVGLHLDEITAIGGPDVRREAEEAIAQVERLDAVITALLARARGDAAPPQDVDLSALVAESISPWARLLQREGRSLQTRVTPGLCARVRPDHVTAALSSLLDNALVHGAGTVTVSVSADGDEAGVAVTDEGAGVPAHLRDAVFERRISGTRSSGIGLGLARALTVAEGGSLRLDPPSRFVISIPLRRAAVRGPAERADSQRPPR
jgi:signal transduction histidine kinase